MFILQKYERDKMTVKRKIQISIDFLMVALLPFLMAYSLIGEMAHEWIGTVMFSLFFCHQALNLHWYKALLRGRYPLVRVLSIAVNLSLLVIMFALMGSGIILSKHLFRLSMLSQGQSDVRNIHLMMSYWGFVLMSFHTGLHGRMILNVMKRIIRRSNKQKYQTLILRCVAGGVAVYGVIAFIKRQLPEYMFLKIQYVFYDFNEPLFFFLVDYISIMLLFVFAAYYLLKFMARGNS
ncbi:DUF4405 domain-containing protein [Eubacterium callanderi]|uniref:Flavinylation-associated cytochrome domain-containing protein n=1 Tax=Eubacterium limosum TaxID=1736 RepID=A0A6N3G289_EUBLI|nr:DUF4405 domain-containing protein [Eubacterium callanderi]MBO1701522.1 DUF4405 domain-containing protein [Eubacterium callanderi]